MHLAEGLLPAGHAAAGFLAAAPFVAVSWRKLKAKYVAGEVEDRALISLCAALTFAVTLFPVPVPAAGATSHMCATPLLGILFGPFFFTLPVALVLLLQALFFAHGGLSTLGANVLTLGVVGPLAGWGIYQLLKCAPLRAGVKIAIACFLGSLSVYLLDAVILASALAGPQPFEAWFLKISAGLLPIQGPLSIVEGILSAAFLGALRKQRPALGEKLSTRAAALVLLMLFLSPPAFASYTGLDEAVFSKQAEAGGRPAAPLYEVEGELLLFTFSFGTFLAGLVVGHNWRHLSVTRRRTE